MRALAATLLALGVLAAPAAAAPEGPPWRSAERMQDLTFEAQSALLLDEPGSAQGLVRRAARAAARPARPGPPAPRAGGRPGHPSRSRKRGPRCPRARRDGSGGGPRPTARRPSARQLRRHPGGRAGRRRGERRGPGCCCASSARPPASRAPAWTRRSPCASSRAAPGPARPLLGVKKDLLDAYQASLADQLGDAERRRRARLPRALGPDRGAWPPASGRSSRPSTSGPAGAARALPPTPPSRSSRAPPREATRTASRPRAAGWRERSTASRRRRSPLRSRPAAPAS